MKKLLLAVLVILAVSCKDKVQRENYKMPKDFEINSIIESIIYYDSLSIPLNPDKAKSDFTKLRNLKIIFPKKVDGIPKPFPKPDMVYVEDLYKIKNHQIFSEKDSSYLKFQNKFLSQVEFNSKISNEFKIVSEKQFYERSTISFSIPIFSSNNNFAYVQMSHFYGKTCLGTISYLLEKKNGKWTVIEIKFISVF